MSNDEHKSFQDKIIASKLQKQKEAKAIRKIVLLISTVIVVCILAIGIGGYMYVSSSLKPVDATSKEMKTVEIPIGSGVTTIGKILEDNGLIKNKTIFRYYVRFNNENNFQAGTYNLSPSMDLNTLIGKLQTGKVARDAAVKLTIPEGLQLIEISELLAEPLGLSSNEVFAEINEKAFITPLIRDYPELLSDEVLEEDVKYPLEGYLFPATYEFNDKNPTLDQLVRAMLTKTNDVVAQYKEEIAASEFTMHEVLTFASIVEEEAPTEEDRKLMASVFYNRMEEGMRLETDPTVLYALGEHKGRVLFKDLEVDSPYNTYRNKGLPPGPIANAGESAIRAILNPTDSDYFFFLAATETGEVHYSKTLDEHEKKSEELITYD